MGLIIVWHILRWLALALKIAFFVFVWLFFTQKKRIVLSYYCDLYSKRGTVPVLAKNKNLSSAQKNHRLLFISSYSYNWSTVPLQIEGIQSKLDSNILQNSDRV